MLVVARRPAPRSSYGSFLIAAVAVAGLLAPRIASAVGTAMFSTVEFSTGEKPQSKIWYHDGSYWAIVQGPDGVAFYEKVGTTWVRGTFTNAVLTATGQADVKWNGTNLFVLNYASTTRLYKYSYVAASRTWSLLTGFPVTLTNPSSSETMVLEQDSSGRLWTTTMSNGSVNAYYSTSADHRTWASSPVVLRTGANVDDISSIVAYGGNRVGVFWSDQNRHEFGFRSHLDTDSPTTWATPEVAFSGNGLTDDHVNLAADSQGRVYAITKDAVDQMRVHRRATNGTWTTKANVLAGVGTRGIIQVSEADARVYILYTRWGVTPERIEYRYADINTLTFGNTTTFISSSANMNNVTGMKQPLPPGSLIALAEDASQCWYNSFGSPPATPPAPPSSLTAMLLAGPVRTQLTWSAPSGTVDGYNIYRQQDGGTFIKLNAALVTTTSYTDASPAPVELCYHVRTVRSSLESVPSSSACVDNTPLPPPEAPVALAASLFEVPAQPALLQLDFDASSGQVALDGSGNANHARLGSSTGSDTADPIWVAGMAGNALQFDGTNDYVEVADASSLDPTGSFTVEAWVRHDISGGTGTIVSKGGTGQRTYRIRITSAGDLEFRWDTTSGSARQATAVDAFLDTNWHHVACVYDQSAGENRVYIDGVEEAAAAATGVPFSNNAVLHIGARFSSNLTDFLEGALDGLRIVPAALYAANFMPPAAPPAGTTTLSASLTWQPPQSGPAAVAYHVYRSTDGGSFNRLDTAPLTVTTWVDAARPIGTHCYRVTAVNAQGLEGVASETACVEVLPPLLAAPGSFTAELVVTPGGAPAGVAAYLFDEATGQSFSDATGNAHTGTRGANASQEVLDPVWAAGIDGSCLRFDGIDDRALVPDDSNLRLTGSFTIEAWIAAAANTASSCLLGKGIEGALNYALRLDAAGHVELRWNDSDAGTHSVAMAAGSPSLADGGWHHIAAVYDTVAAECRIYVDGALAAATPANSVPATSAAALRLGCKQIVGGNAEYFRGSMDLVRVASAALYDAPFVPRPTLDPPAATRVHLLWSPVADAVGYNLYRQEEGGPWELLSVAPLSGTAYDDLSPAAGPACYRVSALDDLGREGAASVNACVQPATTDTQDRTVALGLALDVHPNPLRRQAQFAFVLPVASPLRLTVFDVRGRRITTLVDAPQTAGRHVVVWDGRDARGRRVPAGAYLTVLEAAGRRVQQKLIVLR